MNKTILVAGALLGLTAVVLGAFGAHGLKKVLEPEAINTFETGVKYQMYHALLLLWLGSTSFIGLSTKNLVFYLVLSGVLLFSGSIYGLATNTLTSFDFRKIGFVTPIGGTLLIIGWGVLAYNFFTSKM